MNHRVFGLLALTVIVPACGGGSGAPPVIPPRGPAFGLYGVAYGFQSAGGATSVALTATHQYVAGPVWGGPGAWRIERRTLRTGALDPAFGTAGAVVEPVTGGGWLNSLVLSGSDLFVGGWHPYPLSASPTGRWRLERRSAVDGSLISGFGIGGVVAEDHSADADEILAIAVDATAVYVVGLDSTLGAGNTQWRIEKRLRSDGSLVSGFGAGGVVTSNPSPGYDRPHAVVTDGATLWIVGLDAQPGGVGDYRWRIECRSMSDGALVPAFGAGGVVALDVTPSSDQARAALLHGGALYVAGHDGSGNAAWRIEKRDPVTGALDGAFGVGGSVTENPSIGEDVASCIAADGTDLYIGGYDNVLGAGVFQWRLERRSTVDGSLVNTFGAGGVVMNGIRGGWGGPASLAVSSGELHAVGFDQNPMGSIRADWRLELRSADTGARIAGYGLDGTILVNEAGGSWVQALAQEGAWIYSAAREELSAVDLRWRIQKRRKTDGELDPAFGTLGDVFVDPSAYVDMPHAAGVADGALFVVGVVSVRGQGLTDWRIDKRSLVDGSPVGGFGTGGTVVSTLANYGMLSAVAFDATFLYLVGHEYGPSASWRIEKRRLDTGALDAGFGVNGVITFDPGPDYDAPAAVTVEGASLFIGGIDTAVSAGDYRWRVEKRSCVDGALDGVFGTGGMLTLDFGTNTSDQLNVVLTDGTALYLAGSGWDPSSGQVLWRIEKRSATDGSPVGAFGAGGVVTLPAPNGFSVIHAGLRDGALLYWVGAEQLPPPLSGLVRWRIERRLAFDGSLDATFGNGGVMDSGDPHLLLGAIPYAAAMDATWIFVGGQDSSGAHLVSRIDRRNK